MAQDNTTAGWGCLQAFRNWAIGFAIAIVVIFITAAVSTSRPGYKPGQPDNSGAAIFAVCFFGIFVWGFVCLIMAAKRSDTNSAKVNPAGWRLSPAKKYQSALANLPVFSATQKYISPNLQSAIGVDEQSKKVCIITLPDIQHRLSYLTYIKDMTERYKKEHGVKAVPSEEILRGAADKFPNYDPNSDAFFKIFSYRDILESEVLEDGHSVTKTSRSSQLAGTLVGGLLLGGVGAIIGGLSGKKTTHKKVTRIELKVVVNDTSHPI
jgi:hypothetical protein